MLKIAKTGCLGILLAIFCWTAADAQQVNNYWLKGNCLTPSCWVPLGSNNPLPTINGATTYQAVAASSTATPLQTLSGAAGDYLSHCVIYPTSTSPGAVTVFDNTNTAATSVILFAGGASSTSNLTPIAVPVGAVSTAGAWKVTTGSAVSVVCFGKFS